MILHGKHTVFQALQNPRREKRRLWVTEPNREAAEEALRQVGGKPVPMESIQPKMLEKKLGPGVVHQGVALEVAPLSQPSLEDYLSTLEQPLTAGIFIILDQVTDPHNIGAIIRTAACFGALAVITQERHAPGETPILAKTASGGLEHVPYIQVTNISKALGQLKAVGVWCYAFDSAAETPVTAQQLQGACALVFGAEGKGVRRLVRDHCDGLVKLATRPDFPSLNVSNAVAAALAKAT